MFDEPKDIFSQIDPQKPAQEPMSPSSASMQSVNLPKPNIVDQLTDEELPTDLSSNRKMAVIAVIIVVLIVLTIGALAALYFIRNNQVPLPELSNILNNEEPVVNNSIIPVTEEPVTTTPVVETQAIALDSDGDGLTDDREQILQTNKLTPDSDNDGLTDSEEVNVWLTDPLDSDTDNDGFMDGQEVDNGYDPKQVGGVLLNLPR